MEDLKGAALELTPTNEKARNEVANLQLLYTGIRNSVAVIATYRLDS